MPKQTFSEFLDERFGGMLYHGSHDPNGQACALEAVNAYWKKPWSDSAESTIDIRALNDANWPDDATRTKNLLPVIEAVVIPWPKWTVAKKKRWAEEVALRTVREVLPIAMRAVKLDVEAKRCEAADDLAAASDAASAAWAAASAASAAASAAARAAASAAARAAASAASDILELACRIFVEAAKEEMSA